MNRDELIAFDVENYKNYLLFMFKRFSDGKVLYFEQFNDSLLNIKSIKHILQKYTIVTFNGNKYDHLIVLAGLAGFTNMNANKISLYIIENKAQPWMVRKQFGIRDFEYDHVDIIDVAPLKASLKIYAGRLHAPKMQDLPIHFSSLIKKTDLPLMRSYCENDLDDTILLFDAMFGEMELRDTMSLEYKTDVRSKSDAQIAEAVIKHEMIERYEITPKKPKSLSGAKLYYKIPDYIEFETQILKTLLSDYQLNPFVVASNGHVTTPEILNNLVVMGTNNKSILLNKALDKVILNGGDELDLQNIIESSGCKDKDVKSVLRKCKSAIKNGEPVVIPKKLNSRIIKIGNTRYKIGVGGLHSMEESIAYVPNGKYKLKDYDVAAYYPSIILNDKLAPKHLGKAFLEVYGSIVTRRLKAKAEGNKVVNGSLKIVINGSFGKLASKYSFLYSPDLMMQVTVTGQLSLLMLIEALELNGIPVLSANTDGIVVKILHHQEAFVENIVGDWEMQTGYDMEANEYKSLYSRDVNNYIAVYVNGNVKSKGAFADGGLRNNPVNEICKIAVRLFLQKGTPVEQTIKDCEDITKFVTVRTVNGGALYEGELVGKAIRWYYADDVLDAMYYKTSGNKVPRSDGAKPLMELPLQLPHDIDYAWYVGEANKILKVIGVQDL